MSISTAGTQGRIIRNLLFFTFLFFFSTTVGHSQNTQAGWRWCNKRQGLFFLEGINSSVCPKDSGQHSHPKDSKSGHYSLYHNAPKSNTRQENWRWCNKCQILFFADAPDSSNCPKGGVHEHNVPTKSGNYSININTSNKNMQSDWRWCNKCQGLFYGPGVNESHCPQDNGKHNLGVSNYSIIHTPYSPPPPICPNGECCSPNTICCDGTCKRSFKCPTDKECLDKQK